MAGSQPASGQGARNVGRGALDLASGCAIRIRSLAEQLETLLERHRALAGEGFSRERSIGLPTESGLAGQTLGAYTLIAQIGQGGMSSVWLAERNDARFERKVAVKFLNIALIGRAGEERFEREGIILGRLAHPTYRRTDRCRSVARRTTLSRPRAH